MPRFILRFALGALPSAALCLALVVHALQVRRQHARPLGQMTAIQLKSTTGDLIEALIRQ